MNKSTIITILVGLLVVASVFIWKGTPQTPSTPPPTQTNQTPPTTQVVAKLGEHCGGNMTTAASCAVGLHCAPAPGSHLPFGDVGGVCVAN